MKKLFLFATVVAAGMFAGCSSTDDAISEAANNPIEDIEDNARQAIKINISSPVTVETRGTGTVGGVNGSTLSNVWAGQTIRTFMFTKGTPADDTDPQNPVAADPYATTFNLTNVGTTQTPYTYDNREMITPGSTGNLVTPGYPGGAPDATESVDTDGKGEAMNADYSIQYYPNEGYFDFFGYYPGGVGANSSAVAPTAEINKSDDNKWTVPFTIDGTHDLMSTKAAPTAAEIALLGVGHEKDFYCARAARKNVHPTLAFKHLLTRLSFKAIAGTNEAAGYTPAHNEVTNGVTPAQKTTLTTGEGACQDSEFAIESYTMTGASITNEVYSGLSDDAKTNWAATDNAHNWAGSATITKAQYDALAITISGAVVATYTHTHPVAAATNELNAVKVKSIKIWSKNSGNLAVAWKGDNDDITGYEVSTLSTANYALLDGEHQAHWEYKNGTDDSDGYRWKESTPLTVENYSNFDINATYEAPLINALHGNQFTDANKIEWGGTSAWLTLKARPYAKIKQGVTDKLYTDVTSLLAEYNSYTDATEQAAAVAGLNTRAENLMKEYITQATYDSLTVDGKAKYQKYDGSVNNLPVNDALRQNLIALTPVAATLAGAQVGEALIVAPKDGDYVMEVTIQQRVITNWYDPSIPTYGNKETTYRLYITKPDGGFKINNSYEIQLKVYDFQRIEVITVIKPWVVDADDINLGAD